MSGMLRPSLWRATKCCCKLLKLLRIEIGRCPIGNLIIVPRNMRWNMLESCGLNFCANCSLEKTTDLTSPQELN